MKLRISFLLGMIFLILSCSKNYDAEIDNLNKELMEGHDKVMPKSLIINQIKKELLEKVKDSDDAQKEKALKIASKLQKAEDDMYAWMDDYSEALNTENSEEKVKTYKKLKVAIDEIAKSTEGSIEKARKF
jgi:hypothetical protein